MQKINLILNSNKESSTSMHYVGELCIFDHYYDGTKRISVICTSSKVHEDDRKKKTYTPILEHSFSLTSMLLGPT